MLNDQEHYRIGLNHNVVKYYHPKRGRIKSAFLLMHFILLIFYVLVFIFVIIAIFLTKDLWGKIVGF